MENKILKFHDFQGFPWPVWTLLCDYVFVRWENYTLTKLEATKTDLQNLLHHLLWSVLSSLMFQERYSVLHVQFFYNF